MPITSTFQFKPKASLPKNAVALIYDLEGFSRFFNLPEVQNYMADFLNHISTEFKVVFYGGKSPYIGSEKDTVSPLKLRIAHEKFMGDGALYIILPPDGEADFQTATLGILCNRLWNFKNGFSKLMRAAMDKVPIADLPKKIRFGISRGAVYELNPIDDSNPEYIGFCINLASRLQGYCPDLGFIASARLMVPMSDLDKHGYKKVIATKIKGFSDEIIIVDINEYEKINSTIKSELFRELPPA